MAGSPGTRHVQVSAPWAWLGEGRGVPTLLCRYQLLWLSRTEGSSATCWAGGASRQGWEPLRLTVSAAAAALCPTRSLCFCWLAAGARSLGASWGRGDLQHGSLQRSHGSLWCGEGCFPHRGATFLRPPSSLATVPSSQGAPDDGWACSPLFSLPAPSPNGITLTW